MAAKRARRGFHSSAHRMTVADLPEDAKSSILDMIGTDYHQRNLQRALNEANLDVQDSEMALDELSREKAAFEIGQNEALQGNLEPLRAIEPLYVDAIQGQWEDRVGYNLGTEDDPTTAHGAPEDWFVRQELSKIHDVYRKGISELQSRLDEDRQGRALTRQNLNRVLDTKLDEVKIGLRENPITVVDLTNAK
jgi:hypothetical protein